VLQQAGRELAEKARVTWDRVLGQLLEAIQLARAKADPQALPAKLCHFYTPEKRELAAKDAWMTKLESMFDEELLAIAHAAT